MYMCIHVFVCMGVCEKKGVKMLVYTIQTRKFQSPKR